MKPTHAPAKPQQIVLPVVQPEGETKTGCEWCPLAPMTADFKATLAPLYNRDADKIIEKLKEPHLIQHRCVSEKWDPVDVLFVGEAPGKEEDNKGLPFVGRSGNLLKGEIKKLFDGISYGFTNVCRCRPPMNNDPAKGVIQSCSPELGRELLIRKPKVVVPLGNFSLDYFTGRKGITAVTGHVMRSVAAAAPDVPVVPCLHPAYVLRADHEFPRFIEALTNAATVARGEYTPQQAEGTYYVLEDADDAVALLDTLRQQKRKTALDVETGVSTPFDKRFPQLLSIHLSNEEGEGWTIPWDHYDSPFSLYEPPEDSVPTEVLPDRPRRGTKKYAEWADANAAVRAKMLAKKRAEFKKSLLKRKMDRAKIKVALIAFFTDPDVPKGGQNVKFDVQHVCHSLGIEAVANVSFDTMLRHLTLDDRRGTHGLATLSVVYTGMDQYHRELDDYLKAHPECDPEKGGSYARIPGSILFTYGGMDADATLRCDNRMVEEEEYQKNPMFQRLAEDFFPKLSEALADMEYAGAKVDVPVVKAMEEKYETGLQAVSSEIQQLPEVRQFVADQMAKGKTGKKKADPFDFNPGSDQQVRRILFDYCGCEPTGITDGGFTTLAARYARLKEKDPGLTFGRVVGDAFTKGEYDLFTVKADALHEYERQGVDLAKLILNYRTTSKVLSTYVRPIYERLDENDCVHGSFIPTGTVTGRLASAEPNLQNQPPAFKPAFISRLGPNGVILSADYSQVELRIACSLFNEEKMIRAYLNGEDLHAITAAALAGMPLAQYKKLPKEEQKKWRGRAKRVNFGSIYQAGPGAIQLTLKKDGIFVPLDECAEMLAKFWRTYTSMRANMDALEQQVRKVGYVESFTGRRRRVPEVFSTSEEIVSHAIRQSINMPVQSGASDALLIALCLTHRWLKKEKMQSKLILTVHDQMVVDAHVDEAVYVAQMMRYFMQNVASLSDEILPDLDWSWLKVPLVADFDAGVSWGETVEFDPDVVAGVQPYETPSDWEDINVLHYRDEKGKFAYRKPANVDELWELMGARVAA